MSEWRSRHSPLGTSRSLRCRCRSRRHKPRWNRSHNQGCTSRSLARCKSHRRKLSGSRRGMWRRSRLRRIGHRHRCRTSRRRRSRRSRSDNDACCIQPRSTGWRSPRKRSVPSRPRGDTLDGSVRWSRGRCTPPRLVGLTEPQALDSIRVCATVRLAMELCPRERLIALASTISTHRQMFANTLDATRLPARAGVECLDL